MLAITQAQLWIVCIAEQCQVLAGALVTSEMHCRIQNAAEDTGEGENRTWGGILGCYLWFLFPYFRRASLIILSSLSRSLAPFLTFCWKRGHHPIFSPDIMDKNIILSERDFWEDVTSWFTHPAPFQSPGALAGGSSGSQNCDWGCVTW